MKRKLFQVILEFDDRKDYGSEDFEFIVDKRVEELASLYLMKNITNAKNVVPNEN